ncbi:MAG: BCCT family transporter [Bacteroidota bacterium]
MLSTFRKDLLLPMALGLLSLFSLFLILDTERSYATIEAVSLWVRNRFGRFYLYIGLGCVLLLFGIALSPWGKIKLGAKDERPEHSFWAWIAMLYSAGMGAGILLRAVQEPVFMYLNPPYPSQLPPETLALTFTFYQWGFTAWAFYGFFAMIIGYALFVRKSQVSVSASLTGAFSRGIFGKAVDVTTLITTVFGLVVAVGLGTTQISGGLNHLFPERFGLGSTLLLTLLVCILAGYSAWRGVNQGIKILSKINIIVTLLLLLFVFLWSDIGAVLSSFLEATLQYLIHFVPMSLAYGSYDPGIDFLTDWTFYYWAFWLAYAPFTGIFIARISKGRNLRQMLLGVLIIPSLGTFFWFSVFGSSAFTLIQSWESYHNEFGNVFSSLFVFLENYPFSDVLNGIILVLLVGFLVTSVDSAVFVLSMFTDNGKQNPKKRHRLLWTLLILLTTLALIILGNVKPDIDVLVAVQKLLIITSLPFALFMVVVAGMFVFGLIKNPVKPVNKQKSQ